MIDFELMADVYSFPNLQQLVNSIVSQITEQVGLQALKQLPEGLRALAAVESVNSTSFRTSSAARVNRINVSMSRCGSRC